MNSKYISKREIYDCLDELESITGTSREWEDRDQVVVSAVKATAKAVRAVVGLAKERDVAPVRHGRWKKVIEDDKYYHMECSRCCGRPLRSRWVDDAELSTFCPWCGAFMDKDGDGE